MSTQLLPTNRLPFFWLRLTARRRALGIFGGALLLFLLLGYGAMAWARQEPQPASAISQIWQRVQATGAYEFRANLLQDIVPVAGVTAIGQSSERQEVRIEGATNLRDQTLQMTLWSQGGNVLDRASGLELEAEGGRLLARTPGEEWREISNFTDALIPQGDFTSFLAGATDIQILDPAQHEQAKIRYTYRIDGPTFAAYIRDLLQAQMIRRGELTAEGQLDLPQYFADMQGTGELWIGADGLPLRQLVNLQFPPKDGHWVAAKLDVSFIFDPAVRAAPVGWLATLRAALADANHRLWPTLWLSTLLLVGGGFTLFVVRRRRSMLVYRTLALLCVTAMIGGPLAQSAQAATAANRFAARQEREVQLQRDAEALQRASGGVDALSSAPAAPEVLAQLRADRGQNSDGDQLSDVEEAALGSDPTQVESARQLEDWLFNSQADPTLDSDGDGLNDREEELLGTDANNPDSDNDTITDTVEIAGFTLGGKQWHTNPSELDSNGDGLGDEEEWRNPALPAQDTDNDGTPDLFDRDNDNDGVPDPVDLSPNRTWTTVFSDTTPFQLAVDGLTAGKAAMVEFQLRPTDSDHLWYALNKLDWPADSAGNVQDRDNSPDDVDLIPMLEIRIPSAPYNLPLAATPQVAISLTEESTDLGIGISGHIILTQQGANLAVQGNLIDQQGRATAGFLFIREGTCDQPGKRLVGPITLSSNGVVIGDFTQTKLRDRSLGGHILTVENSGGSPNLIPLNSCGAIPVLPFEGEAMIDQEALAIYGVSVREAAADRVAKLVYVPLTLRTDDPARLNGNRTLPTSQTPRGGRVAFNGLMPYLAGASWSQAHQVRMIWSVLMQNDLPCPAGVQSCPQNLNIPLTIHTYPDNWTLTGLDVRQDNGVKLAIAYEDPAVDADLREAVPLYELAEGLNNTFMVGRTSNGQRDLTVAEIARRFNRTTNGTVTPDERFGIDNLLVVEEQHYPTLDSMTRGSINRAEAILTQNFSSRWSPTSPISPTLLYAYEWESRALNLDLQPSPGAPPNDGLQWDATGQRLTLSFRSNDLAPAQTLATLKVQPYRYNGSRWQVYGLAEFWKAQESFYAADVTADPEQELALGKLRALQLYTFVLGNGLQQVVQRGSRPLIGAIKSDKELRTLLSDTGKVSKVLLFVPGKVLKAYFNDFQTLSSDAQAKIGGKSKQFLFLLQKAYQAERADYAVHIDSNRPSPVGKLVNRIKNATVANGLLLASVGFTAALVLTQMALSLATIGVKDPKIKSDLTIASATLTLIVEVYTKIWVPLMKGKFINVAKAGVTTTKFGLTDKLGSIKAARIMAVVGVVISLVLAWGYFFAAVIGGTASSTAEVNTLLAFTIATTIVTLLLFAISFIPIVGPIISGVISAVDAILTIICEAGVKDLRGVVSGTSGKGSCFTLSGALTEFVAKYLYSTELIFDFSDKAVPTNLRFPAVSNLSFSVYDPTNFNAPRAAGMVAGNSLLLLADVGGYLPPKVPGDGKGFFGGAAYATSQIAKTRILATLNAMPITRTLASNVFTDEEFKILDYTQVYTVEQGTAATRISSLDRYPLYAARLANQRQGAYLGNLKLGINSVLTGSLYVNVSMRVPTASCFLTAVCYASIKNNRDDDTLTPINFSQKAIPPTAFTFDVLPRTLDGFYARNWGGKVAFAPPVDADGDGLRNAAAGGLDPDDSKVDSDGDGLPDPYEFDYRQLGFANSGGLIDPLNKDSDSDTLCDALELQLGSNPNRADSDGDTLLDGQEVYHPECANPAVWSGGWRFTYDAANNQSLRIDSDPRAADVDLDGMNDAFELDRHRQNPTLYPYNPNVFTASPIALVATVDDADNVVRPGATLQYTATVANFLPDTALVGSGAITTSFPAALGGAQRRDAFLLGAGQSRAFASTLTAGSGSLQAEINNIVNAQILPTAGVTLTGAATFSYNQKTIVAIDSDLPQSQPTSPPYIKAGGFYILGGVASDPTSYIKGVDVRVAGQNDFSRATGGEAWSYTWQVPGGDGRYIIESQAIDAVDNRQSPPASRAILVDATPPTLSTDQPNSGYLPAKRNSDGQWLITLSGTVADPAIGGDAGSGVKSVEVLVEPRSSDWQPATVNGNAWSIIYSLSPFDASNNLSLDATGQYTVSVRAADNVENRQTAANYLRYTIRLETTPPVASLVSIGDRILRNGNTISVTSTTLLTQSVVLTGTVSDPGDFASGVQGLEIAFTPAQLVETLGEAAALFYLNERQGETSYINAAAGGNNGGCLGGICPTNDTAGLYGGAVQFDGSTVITASANLSETQLGVSLWFNTGDANSGLFAASDATANVADRTLYLTNGNLCASVRGVQTDEICTAGRNYSDGQWHQAVLVLDENAPFRLYVDGQPGAAAGLVRASTLTTQNEIRLGGAFAPSGEKRLNGRLDEVEVYNASLSAEAVAALYRRWQPVTLSNPGAIQSNWSYPLPAGLEGVYQIELRSQDMVGNRNDDHRDLWRQWRGIIDTTAPRVNLVSSFSGSGATAQTTYHLTLEDFNLTTAGYTGVCPLAAASYEYDTSAFWQRFGNNTPGLRKVTMQCTVNGFPVSGETVNYASATACDRYGRCTQATEGRDLLYWATTENATGVSAIRRANLNSGYEREALLENLPRITGLATDNQRGHIYWLERDTPVTGRVRRSDLAGQNVTTIPINPPPALSQVTFPATFDLVVNPAGGKLYWSEENHIRWANLDGSGAATLFTLPTGPDPQPDRIGSLVVDSVNGKIYFGAIDLVANNGDALAATSDAQLWVINADGSNPSVLVNSNALQNVAVIGLALAQDQGRLFWTQRKRLSDRPSSGDGFFSVATSGGAPTAVIPNAAVTFIGMLEVSPAPANNPNYAYWSVGNTIQQIDLVNKGAGYFADEPPLHLIGASATARLSGLTTTASDLALQRGAYAGIIAVGRVIDYNLMVRNNGPVRAGNVEVVATLPANTSFVNTGSSPTCAPSGPSQIACTLAQLADGGEQNLLIRVQVESGAIPGSTLTTNVTVSHSQSDPNPANNSISFGDTAVIAAPPAVPPSNNYLYYGLNNGLYRLRTDSVTPVNERIVGSPTIGNEVVQGVAVDLRNARVYFAARPSGVSGNGYIRRANLDGTGVTTIYTDTTTPWPTYLALDVDNNQLYFTHGGELGGVNSGDSIKRINVNGSGETTIVNGVVAPIGLAYNPVRAELYWSERGATPRIQRTALNPVNPQTIVPAVTAYDLIADPGADQLYYRRADSATNDNSVYRVLRDGSNLTALTFGLSFHGPALDLANGQFYWWDGTVVGTIFRYSLAGPFPVTNANATQLYAGTGRPTSQVVFAPAVSRYLYWGVNNTLRRIRANGGGTAETVLTAPTISVGEVIEGVAVDSAGGKLYLATRPTGAVTAGYIRQVNLDGSGAKTIYTDTVAPYPTYLALDTTSGQLYFTHGGASTGNAIKRINSDGSSEATMIGNLTGVTGLAVNAPSNELYWSDGSGQLRRASFTGSNPLMIRNGVYAYEINLDGTNRIYYRTRNNSSIFAIQPNGSGQATVQSGNVGGGPVVDVDSNALYWVDKSANGVIYRATLTGSGATNIGVSGAQPTSQLALAFTEAPVVLAAQSVADTVVQGEAQSALANSFAQAVCAVDGYEPDETSATATVVAVDAASPNHNLHTAGDVDWFALDLTAGLRYLISAYGEGSDADPLLELYAGDGTTLLASNDNLAVDQIDSQVSFDAPTAGRFYVKVQTASGAGVESCNTNYALRSEVAATPPLPRLPSAPPTNQTAPLLDSVVLTPTNQTRLESLNQTTVAGAAYAGLSSGVGIATLTVTINGAPFYSVAPGGSLTQTTWTQAWTPAGEGIYTFLSVVTDSSGRVQTQTKPITVFVDLAAPQVTLARTSFTTTHQAPTSSQVLLSGTASDGLGVALVEVNVAGAGWQTAQLANGGWQLAVDFPDNNGGVNPIEVRATDRAGRVTTINANVTVDTQAPIFNRNNVQLSANGTPISSTGTITQANPTLLITWPAAPGATGYYVGWTTSPTATLGSLTFYGAPGSHSGVLGNAQRVYAHVVAVDSLGNQWAESFGPLAIDSPATPDLIDDLRDLRWQQTGGSQITADRAVSKGAVAGTDLGVVQRFYLSWNAATLRLGWNGANWDQDGDLFIYFDTGSGGATQLYNPYNDGTTISLPAGMNASHVIWVRDNRSAALLQAGGNGWTPVALLDSSRFAFGADQDENGDVTPSTQLLLPFSLLGINSNTALGVLAVASETSRLRLWAAAPDKNPLNSEAVINPQATGRTLNNFALTLYHRWPNLNLGQIPNGSSSYPFADSDLEVTVESLWPSNGAGFLASDLLDLLAFNRPLDGDGDGVIDVALPGAALIGSPVGAVGNGLTVQYRIHYANSGPATARNVTVNLTGRGALSLGNGTVNLGDVAPGATGVVTVTGSVGSGAFAELEARVSDGAHGVYDFWLYHHPADTAPPTAVVIEPLNGFAQPGVQLIGGTVQDASAVPTIQLQARFLPGGAITTVTCTDATADDGAWSCLWDAGSLVGVEGVELQAQAVDRFGNVSAFSPVVTLGADLTPPQVTLSAQTEAALADGYLNQAEANLRGQISDNRNAQAVAICNTVIDPAIGSLACRTIAGAPASQPNAAWSVALETFDEDGAPLSLSFAGIDGAGNRGEPITRTFRLDVVAPVITPTVTSETEPVLRGLVSDGGQVARVLVRITAPDGSIQRVTAVLEGNVWSYTPILSTAGVYGLIIEAYDVAGNVAVAGPFSHTVNSVPPPTTKQIYLPFINR